MGAESSSGESGQVLVQSRMRDLDQSAGIQGKGGGKETGLKRDSGKTLAARLLVSPV